MPGIKRKFSSRSRRPLKRTRHWRRRSRPLISRQLTRGVHHFKRTYQGSEITINNVSSISGGWSFSLNSLPSYSEFTALFDEYRINGIAIKLVPLFTSADLNPATTALTVPNLHTVIDYDDSTDPGSLNTILQYPNRRMTRATQMHSRYFRPHVAYAVYKTALASGYGTKSRMWIDCENVDVPHYGFKYCFDGNYGTGSQTITYKSYITMYLSCRGVR